MERDVRLVVGTAKTAQDQIDPICDLYDAVFSEPPFHWHEEESQLHRERLARLLQDATFGVVLAEVGADLVGFAYGYTLPANSVRWSRLTKAVPLDVATEWPGRTFVLFDYAVARRHRGKGIGRALHHTLLGSRLEERATLTVQPVAIATKRIYEHWRWRQVGQMEGGEGAAAPLFDVYVRDQLSDFRSR